MIFFCLCGAFSENSLSKQNLTSTHMLAECMQGEGESLSFFLWLATLCIAWFCLGTIHKGRPSLGGGGGQPKSDQLGQGEGGSGQSGRPFYLMWQG